MRSTIRRPPPPIPGPSNFGHIRGAFSLRVEDNRHNSAVSGARDTPERTSEDAPPLPPRRRPPPPIPPHRRWEPDTSALTKAEANSPTGPSSSSSSRFAENCVAVLVPINDTEGSSSPAESRVADDTQEMRQREVAAGAACRPVDLLESSNASHGILSGSHLSEVAIITPITDPERLDAAVSDNVLGEVVDTALNGGTRESQEGIVTLDRPEQVLMDSDRVLPNTTEGGFPSDITQVRESLSSNAAHEQEQTHLETTDNIVSIAPDDGNEEIHQDIITSNRPEQDPIRPDPSLPSTTEGQGMDDVARVQESSSSSATPENEELRPDGNRSSQLRESEETTDGASDQIEGSIAATQPVQPLQPMFTGLTDLDLLLARLEDPDFTFSGRSYDDLLLLEEIMGPALGTNSQQRTDFDDIPLGRIEVLRRRVTKDGRTKLKLALLGVPVDKCGICLVQFKDGVFACLLPCRHAFHENCLRLWMRRGGTCPLCRGPLVDVG